MAWTSPLYSLPTDTSATTTSRAESHRRLHAQNSENLPSEIDYVVAGAVITVFILVPADGLEDARGYPVLATTTPRQRRALAEDVAPSPRRKVTVEPQQRNGGCDDHHRWRAHLYRKWAKQQPLLTLDVMLAKLKDKFSVIAWIR